MYKLRSSLRTLLVPSSLSSMPYKNSVYMKLWQMQIFRGRNRQNCSYSINLATEAKVSSKSTPVSWGYQSGFIRSFIVLIIFIDCSQLFCQQENSPAPRCSFLIKTAFHHPSRLFPHSSRHSSINSIWFSDCEHGKRIIYFRILKVCSISDLDFE